ncbi:acetyl-CoA carboxylase biotin carboxylase subunit [Zunongwangia profunda]|uniref:Biotin carboxylase n=4 Tax=Zunongwangia profunda TaxID=398743 RepID=D5BA25_ZUNPS|nr:acetyl-CoA carboxylase biotin carboxylase subunit [Zunongwangia profunda]ADF52323.1 biotin carboxylase [Zunongwangia profunda SM-A87]MAC65794.1 acetyl-CoA carboxylase biotin carboxylase subunit [Flavobacteriaceae bacterium]MAS71080.1 acetyl-CoA carboxylase biotin carboxylase subunit [Zunongwangia sp.]|tara:strand:- start:2240 stop:3694 length:1455 start_codon:yes stop_codon:yes gene_type:complete
MKKILVANRGEIALRIMKSIQKMGIKTVAIFSEADRNAPHVKFADEAVCVGPAPSNQSYLLGNKIIEVCKQLNVDGIHPGYGFLSENADFAEAVEEAGISFIGPRSKAIRIMGSKLAAKDAVKKYDIPMVPGIDEAITDTKKAKKIAAEIGYPILIKASAGGGGKGMRVVEQEKDLEDQMKRAISEAKSAFGDGSVFIEKYVASPRHIEIQVLADTHGNTLHLFERECSVQRRHQKVIEEAPSVVLDAKLREEMGKAAVRVAEACDYVGAGTVEFLFDENRNFYFLEMNTRLQVEHPVTEFITGVDLVEEQIKIARGEVLSIKQEDLKIKGHALELRVYAEDAMDNFLPSVGKLEKYQLPHGEKIRVDNGFEEGMDVPIYYDPMLAKLITYGKNREEAIQLMIKAINDYQVEGVSTTLSFGKFVFEHEAFTSGKFDTHFVKNYYSPEKLQNEVEEESKLAALVALKQYLQDQKKLRLPITEARA